MHAFMVRRSFLFQRKYKGVTLLSCLRANYTNVGGTLAPHTDNYSIITYG